MLKNNIHATELASPVQTIQARVELYKGSALERICNCGDTLSNFTIERTGEGKFFGFGICQKLQAVLIDENREINLTKENTIEASFGVNSEFIYPFPNFYIEEVKRDEDANDLTVTAYDILYKAANHTVSELALTGSYTVKTFVVACASLLGVPVVIENVNDSSFDTMFSEGANFDGTETIRSALNAAAEVTQTIYYMNSDWALTFKRLDRTGSPVLTIDKSMYMEFVNDGVVTLDRIEHITELGDNVSPDEETEGITQYIRNNPFWELRDDVAALVVAAQEVVSGTSIHQFECNWFGNYLLEIGDKIALITRDDKTIETYMLNDTLSFNGAIDENTSWHYDENAAESASNPASLGEVINQTYARVDKANKQITLLVGEAESAENRLSVLEMDTRSITAAVSSVETSTKEAVSAINSNFETLSKQVSAKVSAEEVLITVESELSKGVDKVQTSTGFTFNEEGLNVSKSGSEMTTLITEDGMKISRSGQETLTADNTGVKAENLHAITYLIIGDTSRFEDWGGRTGCFWIGKAGG